MLSGPVLFAFAIGFLSGIVATVSFTFWLERQQT